VNQRSNSGSKSLRFGSVEARRAMFAERFHLVWQRVARNPLFAQPVLPTDVYRREYHKLTHIHALQGAPPGEPMTVLGVLTQPSEGTLCLEDLTDSVRLDLSNVKSTAGLFAENCVVIARGVLDESGVFRVSELGLPPAERRSESLDNVTVVGTSAAAPNFFGGVPPVVDSSDWAADVDERVLFLSDVRIDLPHVMTKLCALFDGFIGAGCIPAAFVLIGNFCSPERDDAVLVLADALEQLGVELLARPALLAASYIIFVPGPSDPGGTSVRPIPNAPLPSIATQRLTSRAKLRDRVIFTTNPCHIRVGRQEIVVFRDDVAEKLRRHCVVPPANDERTNDLSQHVVKTLLDESHLCPLPLSVRPIAWPLDHALHLYPLPDVVVLADHFAQFEHTYEECLVLNPGSFPVDYSFVVYAPASTTAEFCIVKEREQDDDDENGDAEDMAADEVVVAAADSGAVAAAAAAGAPEVAALEAIVQEGEATTSRQNGADEELDGDDDDDGENDVAAEDVDEEAERVKLDDLDEVVEATIDDEFAGADEDDGRPKRRDIKEDDDDAENE
jgi:DNA polymerase epsilon subunit 2